MLKTTFAWPAQQRKGYSFSTAGRILVWLKDGAHSSRRPQLLRKPPNSL